MAKPNYQFEKRQRELEKKRKKQEKEQRKATGASASTSSPEAGGTPPGENPPASAESGESAAT